MSHAKLSPSSAHRWLECPGSVRLSAGLESPDNEFSREGTFAHAIAAKCLRENKSAKHYLGESDGEFTVNPEMAAHIQVYVDAITAVVMTDGVNGELHVEKEVFVSQDVWGTLDAAFEDDSGALHVWDLKFGKGIFVDVVENSQLRIYALGAIFGVYAEVKIQRIVYHIVQPRRTDGDGEAHRVWEEPLVDLINWRQSVLAPGVKSTASIEAAIVPGAHCNFCPAAPSCPALREQSYAVTQEVFTDLDSLTPAPKPALDEMPAARLAAILKAAAIAESWIEAVRQHALERARKEVIPGFKVVAKLSNRKWVNEDEITRLLKAAKIDPYKDPELISPAEAERRAGRKLDAKFTERVVTGAVLVPESDKRPAIAPGDVFPLLEN